MTSTPDSRVTRVFRRACELDGDERDRYLDEACRGDPVLRAEVESLLSFDQTEDAALDTPILEGGIAGALLDHTAPEQIGPYRLIRPLGSGSVGAVFEAEQSHPRRRVALKLLRSDVIGDESRRRLSREADILARLDHPAVARILDAGMVDVNSEPRPFLAMELVEGEPLDAYAAQANLDVAGKLKLLAMVADGVAHAHGRGVIHRDLKPANIVVSRDGRPRILDFGIARLLDDDLAASARVTTMGQLLGTLAYMSPEQASGDPLAVDARCDVYSIGVIAYELLSGRLPTPVGGSFATALDRIRSHEPTSLGELDRRLTGDVEVVVAKAIEKDPEQRYQSAAEFAADIRRLLADEPVAARPPNALYQLKKLARRHKVAVAAGSVFLVMLCLALAATALALVEARRQAALAAQREASLTESLEVTSSTLQLLRQLFESVHPEAYGPDVRLTDVLTGFTGDIDQRFAGRKDVAATVHDLIGTTFGKLGLVGRAEEHQRKALDLLRELDDSDPVLLGAVRRRLAGTLGLLGQGPEALALAETALRGLTEYAGPHAAETLNARVVRAWALRVNSRAHEALREIEAVIADIDRTVGEMSELSADARAELANILGPLSRFEEAEATWRRVLEIHAATRAGPVRIEADRTAFAAVLQARGRYDEARDLLETNVADLEEMFGADNPVTLRARLSLVALSSEQSRYQEALADIDACVAGFRRRLGEHSPSHIDALYQRGVVLIGLGRDEEAFVQAEHAVELAKRHLDPDHRATIRALTMYGAVVAQRGDYGAAIEIYRDALARSERSYGRRHADQIKLKGNLASSLFMLSEYAESARILREVIDLCDDLFGLEHLLCQQSRIGLAQVLIWSDDLPEARELLRDCVATTTRVFGKENDLTLGATLHLAHLETKAGSFAEAADRLVEACETMERVLGVFHPYSSTAAQLLLGACDQVGRADEALALLRRRLERSDSVTDEEDPRRIALLDELISRCVAAGLEEEATQYREMRPASSESIADH